MKYFTEHKLNLNIGNSGFLIINPKQEDKRSCIALNMGVLKYKTRIEYLGVFISDSGSLKRDVATNVKHKRPNVSIKYTNFCKVNRNAPLHVKLDVLDMCVCAALIYGCETWGRYISYVEQPYRAGLKTALNARVNVNNEIVHVETGRCPLNAKIKKAQLKFWLFIQNYQAFASSRVGFK